MATATLAETAALAATGALATGELATEESATVERRREKRANEAVTREILMLEAIFVRQNRCDCVFSSYIVGVIVSNVCVLKDRCNVIMIEWTTCTFVYI